MSCSSKILGEVSPVCSGEWTPGGLYSKLTLSTLSQIDKYATGSALGYKSVQPESESET